MTRRWFQIHLSTALVMMVVAGGLMGANCMQREYPYGRVSLQYKGWPFDSQVLLGDRPKEWDASSSYLALVTETLEVQRLIAENDRIYGVVYARLLGNVGFALATLAGIYFLMEWRMRRNAE